MTERTTTSRDQGRAEEEVRPSAGLVPNSSTSRTASNYLQQPIKVRHLKEWARYRIKVGDTRGADVILRAVYGLDDDERRTPHQLAQGMSREEARILFTASVFVLELYRDLGVLA
jgi:hypothetical protein